jgi:hypothetical protein
VKIRAHGHPLNHRVLLQDFLLGSAKNIGAQLLEAALGSLVVLVDYLTRQGERLEVHASKLAEIVAHVRSEHNRAGAVSSFLKFRAYSNARSSTCV